MLDMNIAVLIWECMFFGQLKINKKQIHFSNIYSPPKYYKKYVV